MTGGSMTKAELVEEVSRVSDLTKKHSEVIVDTVFKSIIDALHRGEKIELRGFGSFRLRKREPRKGRNPKTGDKVDVPPKKVPYFKPGKELKELINREPDADAARPARCRRTRSPSSRQAARNLTICTNCQPELYNSDHGSPLVSLETRLRDRHDRRHSRLHLLRRGGSVARSIGQRCARARPRRALATSSSTCIRTTTAT